MLGSERVLLAQRQRGCVADWRLVARFVQVFTCPLSRGPRTRLGTRLNASRSLLSTPNGTRLCTDEQQNAEHLMASGTPFHLLPVLQEGNGSRSQLPSVCLQGNCSQGPRHVKHILQAIPHLPLRLLHGRSRLL